MADDLQRLEEIRKRAGSASMREALESADDVPFLLAQYDSLLADKKRMDFMVRRAAGADSIEISLKGRGDFRGAVDFAMGAHSQPEEPKCSVKEV